ncbi:cytochrome c3 family protein [Sulfuricurvum sp.]|uniref:cytochrome c3 family protein n=1 Tax=Sulfuricurvum sp. TaxID=2025608 RepID=UPI0026341157|nr:cytochrome c3 family protein [Sulfuricurvum sp.]MDD2780056.1 cytochrome c3 family protein [Sulfuricurvum sp.]
MKLPSLLLMVSLLAISCSAPAGIISTKHNLSVSNVTGTTHSSSEQEICVFCHVPHGSATNRIPLWNQNAPATSYEMYNSDYLRRMSYIDNFETNRPKNLGVNQGEPGILSRACLSCHDGTVAVGTLSVLRGQQNQTIADMSGSLPTAVNFGINLKNHHPVGFIYDTRIGNEKAFGDGTTRGMELAPIPTVEASEKSRLYKYGSDKYVECSSCHDPHSTNNKFLYYTPPVGTSHAVATNSVCTSCHEKTNWEFLAAHNPGMTAVNYTDPDVHAKYGTLDYGSLGCINCHTPHKGEGSPYLLRKVEEQTCFQGAAGTVSTAPCHGSNPAAGGKNIQSLLSRSYKHPVATSGKHTNLDVFFGAATSTLSEPGVDWSLNKHAECTDCHNPHQAQKGNHVISAIPNSYYPDIPSNAVSGALRGVTGVDISMPSSWPSRWTLPQTEFVTVQSSTKEYQICFKCHSYWGLGGTGNYTNDVNGIRSPVTTHLLSGAGYSAAEKYVTDQAWEFNPYNRSAHPVVMTINQMWDLSSRSTSVTAAGRHVGPLQATRMKAPWNTNVGNQTMYCSDCHGADDEIGTDPKGPHGSNKSYMLKGVGKYWPKAPSGVLWNIDAALAVSPDLFCQNCHETQDVPIHQFKSGGRQFTNVVCVNCHVAVPHGSPLSRLMGYSNFPEPYNYGGNSLKLTQYKRVETVPYDPLTEFKRSNASYYPATVNCGSGSNGGCHKAAITGYEAVP